jgi:hypothetical protein
LIVIRTFGVCLLLAGAVTAQDAAGPALLAELGQSVRQKTNDWEKLAQSLDSSIIKLLPCDPAAVTAITAVSKASEERNTALAAYLLEASRQSTLQTAEARRVLDSVEPLATDLSTEKLDITLEQLEVNGQVAVLAESGQQRPSFTGAQNALRRIAALEQQRSGAADSGSSRANAAAEALHNLVLQLQAREATLRDAQTAFQAESASWSAYYTARLARAQTECSVSKGVFTTPARGKQK